MLDSSEVPRERGWPHRLTSQAQAGPSCSQVKAAVEPPEATPSHRRKPTRTSLCSPELSCRSVLSSASSWAWSSALADWWGQGRSSLVHGGF